MSTQPTPSLNEIMQKAQEMQAKMQQVQQKIIGMTAEGVAAGGMVRIKINGQQDIVEIFIDPLLLKETADVVAGVIIAAHRDAKRKMDEIMKKEMADIAKDIGLPQGVGGEGGDAGGFGGFGGATK